jgi:hypothetical protein
VVFESLILSTKVSVRGGFCEGTESKQRALCTRPNMRNDNKNTTFEICEDHFWPDDLGGGIYGLSQLMELMFG